MNQKSYPFTSLASRLISSCKLELRPAWALSAGEGREPERVSQRTLLSPTGLGFPPGKAEEAVGGEHCIPDPGRTLSARRWALSFQVRTSNFIYFFNMVLLFLLILFILIFDHVVSMLPCGAPPWCGARLLITSLQRLLLLWTTGPRACERISCNYQALEHSNFDAGV